MSGTIGDNVYRASGVVAAASAGTSWQSVETGSTMTAVAGNGYPVNTTAQACTVTLPAGSVGDTIQLVDYAGTWDTNNVTLTADGSEKIKGVTRNGILDGEREAVTITYVDATQGWIATSAANETATVIKQPYTVGWLVVGGGGSGGYNRGPGGGAAGGYRYGTALSLSVGETYTIAVGGGGASSTTAPNDGSDSSISGSGITTITSTGGGAGGMDGVDSRNGQDGGSGGGAGCDSSNTGAVGSGNTPSISQYSAAGETTTVQGYDGGTCTGGSPNEAGGGGGGASAVGTNSSANTAGAGGAGSANSIIGSSVTYAGGGGGGANGDSSNGVVGAGGAGGGGAGRGSAAGNGDAGSGTDYLGGGGGGHSGQYITGNPGAGGDGIVILRIPTASVGTASGAEAAIIDGAYTVYKWHGNGSYVA